MSLPLNIDWQQILLHLLNFVILAGGLYLLLYKPVKDFMDKRADHYQRMDDEAGAKLKRAEELCDKYEQRLHAAEDEIAQQKLQAFRQTQQEGEQALRQAQAQAEKLLSDAQAQAQAERAKLLSDAQKEITDMVTTATEKLVLQSTASEAFDQFLDAAERREGND
jgi:F-type H+-transporting ATPase subunit b